MTTTEPCQDREDWQTTDEIVTWPPDTHLTLPRDGGEPAEGETR